MIHLTPPLRAEYTVLFETAIVTPAKLPAIESIAKKVYANRDRYSKVSTVTNVPWYIVAAIHYRECNLDFRCHLHNGDPLAARTVQVPAGRPVDGHPPFDWEASAIDALQYDGFNDWHDWTVEGTLYKLEGFNGWGYRLYHSPVNAPYLWSWTNHYQAGKYTSDGQFSPAVIDAQCGAAALLRFLAERALIDWKVAPPLATNAMCAGVR